MKKLLITLTLAFGTYCLEAQPAIAVEKSGNGAPMLFLPGFTNPGTVWEETIQNLDRSFEHHVVSYAGFGGMEPIEMPWYSSIKEELIAYIEQENLTDITVIGHSMGGTLGADIAAQLPTRVKQLIVVDGLPCMRAVMMPNVPAESLQYDSPYNQQMLNMEDAPFRLQVSMMAQYMTFKEDRVPLLTDWMLEADRKTYVYGYTDLLKLDIRESIASIEAPTLILAAPYPDANIVKSTMEEQFEKVKNKRLVIAENSRHFIMFDQPEWFYETVNTFLD